MVLRDHTPPSLQSAGFQNEVSIPCSNTSSLDLLALCACGKSGLDDSYS